MPGAHGAYLERQRFPSLDGLRCLSIVPVVWHHATPRPLEGVLGRGPLGVDLFFAISGFIITTLLLREKRRTGGVAIGDFYARRSLRIFPLYYAVLALYAVRTLVLVDPSRPERAHFFRSLPWYATYTSNWLVDFAAPHPVIFAFAWSLATEEQFYLFWPWIVRAARGWVLPTVSALALLSLDQAVEHGMLTSVLPVDGLARRVTSSIASPICLGALLAYALDRPRTFRWTSKVLGQRASAPAALAVLAVLVLADGVPPLAYHLAMAALVGAAVLRPDHGLARVLDAAPVRHVGVVSYGVYLVHVSAVTAAKHVLPAPLRGTAVVFAVALASSVVVASASYRWFELPFLRLRERFRAQPSVATAG